MKEADRPKISNSASVRLFGNESDDGLIKSAKTSAVAQLKFLNRCHNIPLNDLPSSSIQAFHSVCLFEQIRHQIR